MALPMEHEYRDKARCSGKRKKDSVSIICEQRLHMILIKTAELDKMSDHVDHISVVADDHRL